MTSPTATTHPLLQRLLDADGLPSLTPDTLDAFAAAQPMSVLLFANDPVKYPETLDLAVVLPELLRDFRGKLAAAMVLPPHAQVLQPRFGFSRWPALVFLREGRYVGTIAGMQDWSVYVREIARLLQAAPSQPPAPRAGPNPLAQAGCH